VAGIDYDIENSKMLYKRDLVAFKLRVDKLFEWRERERERAIQIIIWLRTFH